MCTSIFQSAGTCDRNPEHLEAFVAAFYRWHEAQDIIFFSIAKHNLSVEAFAQNEKHVMQETLTPEFYHWTTIYTANPPPEPDHRYCQDGDVMLCAQAWNSDQILNAKAKIVDMNKADAKVIVTFPAVQKTETAYTLVVCLRSVNGFWRIDGVTPLLR